MATPSHETRPPRATTKGTQCPRFRTSRAGRARTSTARTTTRSARSPTSTSTVSPASRSGWQSRAACSARRPASSRSATLAAAEGHIHVPFEKDLVKNAPSVEADGELSPEEERALYDHYGQDWGDFDASREYESDARFARDDEAGTVGRDTSGPTTDQAMTRSEEELRVGKTSEETGRARLRKYVVTEDKQVTVPVQREEVRVEREPITEGNVDQATDGPAISEEEHEVTLHAETPVVDKQVVPKERVRLDKETVTEERTVNEEVRKEQIEADGDTGRLDR